MDVLVTLVAVCLVGYGVYYYLVKPRASVSEAVQHIKSDVAAEKDKLEK